MREYLTVADVVAMQRVLISRYGGAHGIRDMGAIEAACYRPQSGYYDNIIAEAAALMESLAMNHPFIDGNKRIAFAATDVFLRINGYRIISSCQSIYAQMIQLFEQQQFELHALDDMLRNMVKEI